MENEDLPTNEKCLIIFFLIYLGLAELEDAFEFGWTTNIYPGMFNCLKNNLI